MGVPSELINGTIWLALALVSLVAWFILRRRRRASDHPHCHKCDFDLFGLPETSHNCPECGTDIRAADTRPSSVAVLSKWRWLHLVSALICLALAATQLFQYVSRPANYWHHPTFLHALRYAAGVRGGVLDELAGRVPDQIGTLSAWLIGRSTTIPTEPVEVYSNEFAAIALARALGYVDDEPWARLVESSMTVSCRAMYWRPGSDRQLLVMAELATLDPRPSHRATIIGGGWLTATIRAATLDDVPLGPPAALRMPGSGTFKLAESSATGLTERSTLLVRLQLTLHPQGALSAGHTWEVVVPATIEVQGR